MLDWLFGKANKTQDNSKRTQLYFRDDGKFCFRKLPVISGALVRKKGDNFLEGWEHHYNNQFAFDGFKDIPGDMVTINSARDVVFDPHNIVNPADKPDKSGRLNQPHIASIATSAIYAAQKQKPKGLIMDKVTLGIVIVTILMGLAFFISRVTH
jgi:hypothetical protein